MLGKTSSLSLGVIYVDITSKSQHHLIEMALALQIENEDSTVLDTMISLADVTTPQADFQF